MPDSRTIGSPREAINRPNGTIASNRRISTGTSIGSGRTVASGITTSPPAIPVSDSEIQRINRLMIENASKYISVPYRDTVVTTGNGEPAFPGIPRNPFEVLADALQRSFGGSVYNPPLTQQSYGYGSTSGTNWTLLIIIGVIGVGAYFYFNR